MLGRRIGRGGMGVVHAALERRAGGIARLVAVKVLAADRSDDPAERAAFLREARILARLDHPNVVRWFDAGEVGADVYLSMELLHGASLARLVEAAREMLPLPIALGIVCDLARGLHAAHELEGEPGRPIGLVHQDVSPQNAVVGYDGRTRLVDFGIARLASVDASRTDTVRGKPAYLAPEQLEGRRLDRRTDVFALGVIAFELFSGRRLFARASIAETHTAVLFDPIPDLRDAAPDLPAGIALAVGRALSRSMDGRPPTAEAFRRELVAARDAAAIALADDHEIGALVRARVPPAWTPGELLSEIEADRVDVAGPPIDVTGPAIEEASQAVTVAPRRERVAAPAERAERSISEPPIAAPLAREPTAPLAPTVQPQRSRTALVVSLAVLALAALGVFLRARDQPYFTAPNGTSAAATDSATASASQPIAPEQPSAEIGPDPAVPTNPATAVPTRAATARPVNATAPAASSATVAPTASATSATSASPTPAPSTSASTAPAPTNGWVSVWSTPWGRVRIDGRDVGDSPAVRIAVPPGPHTVSVKSESGEQSRGVNVEAGQEAKVRFVF